MNKHSHDNSPSRQIKLGDFSANTQSSLDTQSILKLCNEASFKEKNLHQRLTLIFSHLTDAILKHNGSVFLLPTLVKFFKEIKEKDILPHAHMAYYELWLNQFSGLSHEDNYKIRAKIAGKYLPRDFYQTYFPIGQNKTYFGSHIVTAHSSPDLDTTVASFWGWIDAFAARVSEGLHHWNVPGGAPNYQVEFKLIFDEIFSTHLFPFCAKHKTSLQVTSLELITQKGLLKRSIDSSSLAIDLEKTNQAVVLVDHEGYFKGDWRTQDVEGVRQVVMLVNQTLRHFENNFQSQLISLFARSDLKKEDLTDFVSRMLMMSIQEAETLKDISDQQRKHVSDYLKYILGVESGYDATINDVAEGLSQIHIQDFSQFINLIKSDIFTKLFDKSGHLIASRSDLFTTLDQVIVSLDKAIRSARHFVDQLKVSLEIKSKVFGYKPHFVSEKADTEELRAKMGNNSYLTVTMTDEEGLLPIGVIYAQDLYKPILGTVTLRDFCNREETKVPSYLEVISVVDHHKSQLSGSTPSTVYISDAQSSNVLTANLSFKLNDQVSTAGMTREQILDQLEKIDIKTASNSLRRVYRRLLQKLEALDKRGHFYVDPSREYIEYQHFLYAILDDTDMLSKISRADVECVKDLINRMKTLALQEEVEVVHFDDISESEDFVASAGARLLRNADLFSITQKIYKHKEHFIDEVIEKAAKQNDTLFFADTKEQNGCVRVGQFKLYPINFSTFKECSNELKQAFIDESRKVSERKKEVDFHIYMISTLAGLEGLFDGKVPKIEHEDEVWLYVPKNSETGLAHLRSFLNNFCASNGAKKALRSCELINCDDAVDEIIDSSLLTQIQVKKEKVHLDLNDALIVIKVLPGSMNSRKAMITPFLPKLLV